VNIVYSFEEELNPDAYNEIKEIGAKDRQLDGQGKARLFVALGKKDKLDARKLVDLVTKKSFHQGQRYQRRAGYGQLLFYHCSF